MKRPVGRRCVFPSRAISHMVFYISVAIDRSKMDALGAVTVLFLAHSLKETPSVFHLRAPSRHSSGPRKALCVVIEWRKVSRNSTFSKFRSMRSWSLVCAFRVWIVLSRFTDLLICEEVFRILKSRYWNLYRNFVFSLERDARIEWINAHCTNRRSRVYWGAMLT